VLILPACGHLESRSPNLDALLAAASVAGRAEMSGVSYFAQIPDGQRRKLIVIDTPSVSVGSSIQAGPERFRTSVA